MLATMHLETHGGTSVARIVGEVDASNATGFATQLKETLPNSALGLVLDLSETSYLDSSGVHLIFDLADALRRRQQTLQLVVAPETFVADVVAAVNLRGAAGASATLPEALEVLRNHSFWAPLGGRRRLRDEYRSPLRAPLARDEQGDQSTRGQHGGADRQCGDEPVVEGSGSRVGPVRREHR